MFRFILIGVFVYLLFRLLKLLFSPRAPRRPPFTPPTPRGAINEMVRDPHCGMYVIKTEAYANRVGNEVLYFCSEECYKKYLQNHAR